MPKTKAINKPIGKAGLDISDSGLLTIITHDGKKIETKLEVKKMLTLPLYAEMGKNGLRVRRWEIRDHNSYVGIFQIWYKDGKPKKEILLEVKRLGLQNAARRAGIISEKV